MMLIAGLTDYVKRRQAEVGVRITQRTADKYERLLRYSNSKSEDNNSEKERNCRIIWKEGKDTSSLYY